MRRAFIPHKTLLEARIPEFTIRQELKAQGFQVTDNLLMPEPVGNVTRIDHPTGIEFIQEEL